MKIKTKYSIGQQVESKADGSLEKITDISLWIDKKGFDIAYYVTSHGWYDGKGLRSDFYINDFIIKD